MENMIKLSWSDVVRFMRVVLFFLVLAEGLGLVYSRGDNGVWNSQDGYLFVEDQSSGESGAKKQREGGGGAEREEAPRESDTSREGARFGSSRGGQTPPLVPAPVTVSGTMCVSEQKQKKLSAPLVGRRGGMGACGVTPPASRHARASACSWTPRAAPTFQFHR